VIHILDEYARLLEAESELEWARELVALSAHFGFERIVFAVVPTPQSGIEHGYLQSTYPERWRDLYDRQGLANHDPTVLHCRTKTTPLVWSPDIYRTIQQEVLREEAAGFGLRAGVTLPMHGPNGIAGMLSLASDRPQSSRNLKEIIHFLPALTLLRDVAFERGRTFFADKIESERPRLTKRELECLKWLVAGKSSWDIAQILKISVATVDFHIKNLRIKLDASSRRIIAIKAIQLGLVDID
jgi:LuxR family quorum-sensing transcriptional regulator LasR